MLKKILAHRQEVCDRLYKRELLQEHLLLEKHTLLKRQEDVILTDPYLAAVIDDDILRIDDAIYVLEKYIERTSYELFWPIFLYNYFFTKKPEDK